MNNQTTQQNTKFDLYQNITDRIVMALEAGTAPWLKPWSNTESKLTLPRNAISNRYYNGVNVLLLWLAAAENGYRQSKWITMKAANDLGARIRKGEKATLVVNYNPVEKEKLDEDGNVVLDEQGNPEMVRFSFIKNHYLFNIEQCENLPTQYYDVIDETQSQPEQQYQKFAEIRQIVEGINLTVEVKPSNKAFYHPKVDTVVMPEMKQFNSEEGFYSVLLHEMTHSTGHKDRLNREGITSGKAKFGNDIYAFEELVAEMGGAFLCAYLGFDTVPQNASYIESWIKVLKEDKRAIFRASGKAREACDYMLDTLKVMQQYERLNAA
ncbi:ArdC family protein [Ursidibacter sp. B-7004-1]